MLSWPIFLKTYSRLNDAEHFFWMLVFVFICPQYLTTHQTTHKSKISRFYYRNITSVSNRKNWGTKPSVIHCQNVSEAAVLCWKKSKNRLPRFNTYQQTVKNWDKERNFFCSAAKKGRWRMKGSFIVISKKNEINLLHWTIYIFLPL